MKYKSHRLANSLISILMIILPIVLRAQEDSTRSKTEFTLNADLVSCYVWRGVESDLSPNIQPTLAVKKNGFELGVWGSSNFTGSYREVDVFASYTLKNFTLELCDFFCSDTRYFDLNNISTGHITQAALLWEGPEKLPLTLSINSFIYGNDKILRINTINPSGADYINQYSSYAEIGYALKANDYTYELKVGATPWEGYYGNSPGIVNIELSGSREIKITQDFSMPVKTTFIANPQTGNVYFVFGLTFE